jgi:hypothetical protein
MSDYLTPRRDQGQPDGYQPPDSYQTPDHYYQSSPGSYDPRDYFQPTEQPRGKGLSKVAVGLLCGGLGLVVGVTSTLAVSRGIGGGGAGVAPAATHSRTQTPSPTPSSDEIMVTGSLTLKGSDNFTVSSDGSCSGADWYSDIDTGAQVSVYDGSSKQIAFGPLIQSKVTGGACVFQFLISEIPRGESIYNFKIGDRGGPSFHEDDLDTGDIALTLGD